ncbi:hypothetical protein JQ575_37530 [Bradyrhizobium sp. JYMT SZCCT0428]|nr:hypothetical protein [Bradyrhizobium sp. JYMT SZCCT0428]
MDRVRFPTRIRNALNAAGLKTIGEIREASDRTLLSFQDLGRGSLAYLRKTLDLSSSRGGGHFPAAGRPLRPAQRSD